MLRRSIRGMPTPPDCGDSGPATRSVEPIISLNLKTPLSEMGRLAKARQLSTTGERRAVRMKLKWKNYGHLFKRLPIGPFKDTLLQWEREGSSKVFSAADAAGVLNFLSSIDQGYSADQIRCPLAEGDAVIREIAEVWKSTLTPLSSHGSNKRLTDSASKNRISPLSTTDGTSAASTPAATISPDPFTSLNFADVHSGSDSSATEISDSGGALEAPEIPNASALTNRSGHTVPDDHGENQPYDLAVKRESSEVTLLSEGKDAATETVISYQGEAKLEGGVEVGSGPKDRGTRELFVSPIAALLMCHQPEYEKAKDCVDSSSNPVAVWSLWEGIPTQKLSAAEIPALESEDLRGCQQHGSEEMTIGDSLCSGGDTSVASRDSGMCITDPTCLAVINSWEVGTSRTSGEEEVKELTAANNFQSWSLGGSELLKERDVKLGCSTLLSMFQHSDQACVLCAQQSPDTLQLRLVDFVKLTDYYQVKFLERIARSNVELTGKWDADVGGVQWLDIECDLNRNVEDGAKGGERLAKFMALQTLDSRGYKDDQPVMGLDYRRGNTEANPQLELGVTELRHARNKFAEIRNDLPFLEDFEIVDEHLSEALAHPEVGSCLVEGVQDVVGGLASLTLWKLKQAKDSIDNLKHRLLEKLESEASVPPPLTTFPAYVEGVHIRYRASSVWHNLIRLVETGHVDVAEEYMSAYGLSPTRSLLRWPNYGGAHNAQQVEQEYGGEGKQLSAKRTREAVEEENPPNVITSSGPVSSNPDTQRRDGAGVSKYLYCCVCFNSCYFHQQKQLNPVVECSRCRITVHKSCYGISEFRSDNAAEWICDRCEAEKKLGDKMFTPGRCFACLNCGGALKPTTDGPWIHISCAIYLFPEIRCQNLSKLSEWDTAQLQKWRFQGVCTLCRRLGGALIRCAHQPQSVWKGDSEVESPVTRCSKMFHPMCGWLGGLLTCCSVSQFQFLQHNGEDDFMFPALSTKLFCHKHSAPTRDAELQGYFRKIQYGGRGSNECLGGRSFSGLMQKKGFRNRWGPHSQPIEYSVREDGLFGYSEHLCAVCLQNRSGNGDDIEELVACSKCEIHVHRSCYTLLNTNVLPENEGEFTCDVCLAGYNNGDVRCVLCPLRGGAMLLLKHDEITNADRSEEAKGSVEEALFAHVTCSVFCSSAEISGQPDRESPAGANTAECSVCSSTQGFAIQCSYSHEHRGLNLSNGQERNGNCTVMVHPLCAQLCGCILQRDELESGEVTAASPVKRFHQWVYCRKHSLEMSGLADLLRLFGSKMKAVRYRSVGFILSKAHVSTALCVCRPPIFYQILSNLKRGRRKN
eukprot:GHVN01058883.1.p1 GENE.GHVN01058883.1~~GHVN01058883.1.p1  ORF type:complete len:1379 (+),score=123.26 GHVN01058883.1:180-4139(+)